MIDAHDYMYVIMLHKIIMPVLKDCLFLAGFEKASGHIGKKKKNTQDKELRAASAKNQQETWVLSPPTYEKSNAVATT